MRKILTVAGAALLMLSGSAMAQTVDPNRAAQADPEGAFQSWLQTFRTRALQEGISPATLDRELSNLELSERTIELDRRQPDVGPGRSLYSDYIARRLTQPRIDGGVRLYPQVAPTLEKAEAEYGVPGEIVLAIWGMETSYGAVTGNFDVVRSLASLAFDGRREALFTKELVAALKIIDANDASRSRMTGSWAGAMGNSQFLPTSYLTYAVDFDGDGHPNIWGSESDTIASIANYLKQNGWQRGGEWAIPVNVPQSLNREAVRNPTPPTKCVAVMEKHSRWMPISEWKKLGVAAEEGRTLPSDDTLATLLEVDGEGTGAHLTFQNYRALLDYNCSNFYALSVGQLADEIAARTQ
ncbi:lytic murein transglycosylase [Pacificimonas flava]|uniref:Membrane-bound lytic murein transglycosylase B n=1 Tax=Pacificimonas flava TaxID=1234595 RepID=M2SGP1_9SPHN|nr:lytic murein transglycosylase [Pacificimonas flava]EMD84550.1 Membrane-bound lytic murein transglycosylase B precursor [Pacificimonas flava]MBB5279578.1 lytic murein transglycosylase [Pacificimonas flava]